MWILCLHIDYLWLPKSHLLFNFSGEKGGPEKGSDLFKDLVSEPQSWCGTPFAHSQYPPGQCHQQRTCCRTESDSPSCNEGEWRPQRNIAGAGEKRSLSGLTGFGLVVGDLGAGLRKWAFTLNWMLSEMTLLLKRQMMDLRKQTVGQIFFEATSATTISLNKNTPKVKRTADNLQWTCNLMQLFPPILEGGQVDF